jgi:hypothetical protein
MDAYKTFFAPDYEKNSDMLAITKAKDGKFKAVNMSDFIPYAAVTEPIEAFFNTRKNNIMNNRSVTNSLLMQMFSKNGPVLSFINPYLSTPIGFEPFVDIFLRGGKTKTGSTIFSETDQPTEIFDKMMNYIIKVLEPGAVTSYKKFKDAFFKQPTKGGVLREVGDLTVGASTGIKPYNVDIQEALRFKISEFTRIRRDVFKAEDFYNFKDLYTRGGDVLVEEFINIQKEAFREQKAIYDAIQAAKKLDLSNADIVKIFKQRKGLSDKAIRLIMSGKFNPVNFSESLFEEKLRKLSKIEDEQGFKYDLPKSFVFPKNDLKKVIRKLNRDSLEKDFYYDVQKEKEAMELRGDLPTGIETTQQEPQQVSQKPETPPLPLQPMPNQQVVQTAALPASGATMNGLTPTENALLSEEEKMIKLRSRGIA